MVILRFIGEIELARMVVGKMFEDTFWGGTCMDKLQGSCRSECPVDVELTLVTCWA